ADNKSGSIDIWNTRTGRLDHVLPTGLDDLGSSDLAFSPDGNLLASAPQSGTVTLWNVVTGASVRTFLGHPGERLGLRFSADGQRLTSFANSGVAALMTWDIPTANVVTESIKGFESLWIVAVASDGARFVSRDEQLGFLTVFDRQPGPE